MTAITHCLAAPGSQEWLDARQQGIGGSDIATLLGHDPYATPLQLWRIKMGMETDPFTGNYVRSAPPASALRSPAGHPPPTPSSRPRGGPASEGDRR